MKAGDGGQDNRLWCDGDERCWGWSTDDDTHTIEFTIDRARRASQRKAALIQAINTLPVDGDFLCAQSTTSSKPILTYFSADLDAMTHKHLLC